MGTDLRLVLFVAALMFPFAAALSTTADNSDFEGFSLGEGAFNLDTSGRASSSTN